jgi:uncharacterized SAM-binding protein YcdF (DUF218 family)
LTTRAKVLVGGVLVVVLVVAASSRLFVWSPIDAPQHVDAIVALGGDPGQRRAEEAITLARAGYAPVAVISLGGNPPAECPKGPRRVQVMCFRPNPLDTRGEAEYVTRLAARRHWRRLIVVSERSQATRARMLFKRCTTAQVLMVPVDDPLTHLPYDVAYEWGALAKALLLHRTC